jgi:hypothetical protein
MKESKNNDSSRRDFIKTSAKIALGSTLAGAVTPPEVTAQGTNINLKYNHGDHVDHPGGQKYFKGKMKLPDWLADTSVEKGDDNKDYFLFPEEAIHQDKNYGFDAFFPPGTQAPFEDPIPILGAPFNKDPNSHFDLLLSNIALWARNYNAALYWMRRLHFHLKHRLFPKDFKINTAPPRNPHGDNDDPNHDVSEWQLNEFNDANTLPIKQAQERWGDAITKLNGFLATPQDVVLPDGTPKTFKQVWADMVQVNGYIVSIRLVADEKDYNPLSKLGVLEMGGSSSSHISISSAFSSH